MEGKEQEEIIEIFDSDSNDSGSPEPSGRYNRKRKLEDEAIEVESSSSSEEYESTDESDDCIEISESESEPEVECDVWDEDCRIIKIDSYISVVQGRHPIGRPTSYTDEPLPKQIKLAPEFRTAHNTPQFVADLKNAWDNDRSLKGDMHELITEPFKLCILKNFLENPLFLNEVRAEFNEIKWNHRNMDLYELFQSEDLKRLLEFPHIQQIYQLLKNEVMKWVADLTGFNLTKISATCSYYTDTNYLLVHDDQQDDRMVAFVLYLTGEEGWESDWGGALQMFERDDSDQPTKPMKNVLPENNQFIFFPVSSKSYHQVEEVTNKNFCRLSINGWFHVETPPAFKVPKYDPPTTGIFGGNALLPVTTEVSVEDWIVHYYLNADTVQDIQYQIEESSEISLQNYFKEEKYKKLLGALSGDEVKWRKFGPPSRRNYEVLIEEDLPEIIKEFLNLFRSREMFALLEGYTELELASKTGTMRYELSRWSPGCYSLLSDDYDWQGKSELDLIMYFNCDRKSDIVGGRVQYIGTEESIQQALITLDPEPNTLNIVFRDTARVIRHVSKQSKTGQFYMLICSYAE